MPIVQNWKRYSFIISTVPTNVCCRALNILEACSYQCSASVLLYWILSWPKLHQQVFFFFSHIMHSAVSKKQSKMNFFFSAIKITPFRWVTPCCILLQKYNNTVVAFCQEKNATKLQLFCNFFRFSIAFLKSVCYNDFIKDEIS